MSRSRPETPAGKANVLAAAAGTPSTSTRRTARAGTAPKAGAIAVPFTASSASPLHPSLPRSSSSLVSLSLSGMPSLVAALSPTKARRKKRTSLDERDPSTADSTEDEPDSTISGDETFALGGSNMASDASKRPVRIAAGNKASRKMSRVNIASDRESQNICVCVRLRPPEADASELVNPIWDISTSDGAIIKPSSIHPTMQRRGESTSKEAYEFHFNAILQQPDTTESLYWNQLSPIIQACLDGYNSTIFSYGQTGSGKTHTMMGSDDEPGIIPLAVSYLEIYNEALRDLLASHTLASGSQSISGTSTLGVAEKEGRRALNISEKDGRMQVANLEEQQVASARDVLEAIQKGEESRSVAGTDWNQRSSRSHCVFSILIESKAKVGRGASPTDPIASSSQNESEANEMLDGPTRQAQLNLIDLAGSERAASDETRRQEGKNINKSLLYLGNTIQALSEGRPPRWRDSKLTHLLKSSLSGNARIAIVCTISPESRHGQESVTTLKFAQRATKIETRAQKHFVVDSNLARYQQTIASLECELRKITQQLFKSQDSEALEGERQKRHEAESQAESLRYEKLRLLQQIDKMQSQRVTSTSASAFPPTSPSSLRYGELESGRPDNKLDRVGPRRLSEVAFLGPPLSRSIRQRSCARSVSNIEVIRSPMLAEQASGNRSESEVCQFELKKEHLNIARTTAQTKQNELATSLQAAVEQKFAAFQQLQASEKQNVQFALQISDLEQQIIDVLQERHCFQRHNTSLEQEKDCAMYPVDAQQLREIRADEEMTAMEKAYNAAMRDKDVAVARSEDWTSRNHALQRRLECLELERANDHKGHTDALDGTQQELREARASADRAIAALASSTIDKQLALKRLAEVEKTHKTEAASGKLHWETKLAAVSQQVQQKQKDLDFITCKAEKLTVALERIRSDNAILEKSESTSKRDADRLRQELQDVNNTCDRHQQHLQELRTNDKHRDLTIASLQDRLDEVEKENIHKLRLLDTDLQTAKKINEENAASRHSILQRLLTAEKACEAAETVAENLRLRLDEKHHNLLVKEREMKHLLDQASMHDMTMTGLREGAKAKESQSTVKLAELDARLKERTEQLENCRKQLTERESLYEDASQERLGLQNRLLEQENLLVEHMSRGKGPDAAAAASTNQICKLESALASTRKDLCNVKTDMNVVQQLLRNREKHLEQALRETKDLKERLSTSESDAHVAAQLLQNQLDASVKTSIEQDAVIDKLRAELQKTRVDLSSQLKSSTYSEQLLRRSEKTIASQAARLHSLQEDLERKDLASSRSAVLLKAANRPLDSLALSAKIQAVSNKSSFSNAASCSPGGKSEGPHSCTPMFSHEEKDQQADIVAELQSKLKAAVDLADSKDETIASLRAEIEDWTDRVSKVQGMLGQLRAGDLESASQLKEGDHLILLSNSPTASPTERSSACRYIPASPARSPLSVMDNAKAASLNQLKTVPRPGTPGKRDTHSYNHLTASPRPLPAFTGMQNVTPKKRNSIINDLDNLRQSQSVARGLYMSPGSGRLNEWASKPDDFTAEDMVEAERPPLSIRKKLW